MLHHLQRQFLKQKILVSSIWSDSGKGARFMSVDLKDFFLQSFMNEPEFMHLPFKWFPADIVKKYNLKEKKEKMNLYTSK